MIKQHQKRFYAAVGKALTIARERRNMSITELASYVGEQYNTIKGIESGTLCSLHHVVWMKKLMGLNFTEIIKNMEATGDEKENREDIYREMRETNERIKAKRFNNFI